MKEKRGVLKDNHRDYTNSPYSRKRKPSKPAKTDFNLKGLLDFHREKNDTEKILKAINEYIKKEM